MWRSSGEPRFVLSIPLTLTHGATCHTRDGCPGNGQGETAGSSAPEWTMGRRSGGRGSEQEFNGIRIQPSRPEMRWLERGVEERERRWRTETVPRKQSRQGLAPGHSSSVRPKENNFGDGSGFLFWGREGWGHRCRGSWCFAGTPERPGGGAEVGVMWGVGRRGWEGPERG